MSQAKRKTVIDFPPSPASADEQTEQTERLGQYPSAGLIHPFAIVYAGLNPPPDDPRALKRYEFVQIPPLMQTLEGAMEVYHRVLNFQGNAMLLNLNELMQHIPKSAVIAGERFKRRPRPRSKKKIPRQAVQPAKRKKPFMRIAG